jgi:ribosome recycling factor
MMALRALLRSRAAVRLFATEARAIPVEIQEKLPQGTDVSLCDSTPEPVPHLNMPEPFPQRTYGNFSSQLSAEAKDLSHKLATVLPGKASEHMFAGLNVYAHGDFVPFHIAARTTKISDDEVSVFSYDYYQAPMIELSLKQCGLKLDITRNFNTIKVKVLDYNREAAIKQVEDFAATAKQKVRDIFAKQRKYAQTYGLELKAHAETLHLRLIDETVAEKKSTL